MRRKSIQHILIYSFLYWTYYIQTLHWQSYCFTNSSIWLFLFVPTPSQLFADWLQLRRWLIYFNKSWLIWWIQISGAICMRTSLSTDKHMLCNHILHQRLFRCHCLVAKQNQNNFRSTIHSYHPHSLVLKLTLVPDIPGWSRSRRFILTIWWAICW